MQRLHLIPSDVSYQTHMKKIEANWMTPQWIVRAARLAWAGTLFVPDVARKLHFGLYFCSGQVPGHKKAHNRLWRGIEEGKMGNDKKYYSTYTIHTNINNGRMKRGGETRAGLLLLTNKWPARFPPSILFMYLFILFITFPPILIMMRGGINHLFVWVAYRK